MYVYIYIYVYGSDFQMICWWFLLYLGVDSTFGIERKTLSGQNAYSHILRLEKINSAHVLNLENKMSIKSAV